MEGEVKERGESRYGRAERKGPRRIRRKAGRANTHMHGQKNGKLLTRNKTSVLRGYSERSFSCPRQNMTQRKSGAAQDK